jgi:endoglucanase
MRIRIGCFAVVVVMTIALGIAGCRSGSGTGGSRAQAGIIRINAGAEKPVIDSQGRTWLADTGFADGEIVDRGEIAIQKTKIPEIYRTERWGMTSFSHPIPNGKYLVRLHFAETYDGITAKGGRVFSVTVEGTPIQNLDVFAEAGGPNTALVREVPVTVTDEKLDITFTLDQQNPEINGIEIVPSR